MDISYHKCIWGAGQILVLWMPLILAGCDQDLNVLRFGAMQKFVALDREIHASCQTLLNGQTEECSQDCDEQVMQMVELYEGSAIFFTCDCTKPASIFPTDVCLNVQERLAICPSLSALLATRTATTPASTTPTILEDGMVPCEKAHGRCVDNTNCRSQLHTTIDACAGPGCHDACQRSLNTLLAQREAQDLWGCTWCGQSAEEANWCDLARRCKDAQTEGTVASSLLPYKPGGTAKTTEDESVKGGSSRKSMKPSENSATPIVALCFSSVLYLVISVSLCIVFV